MIVISGAGIGGLTLGCVLWRPGRPFRILERTAHVRAVGAGIALSANAFQALAHMGIEEQVRGCGWELEVAEVCDPKGRTLMRMPMRDFAAGGLAGEQDGDRPARRITKAIRRMARTD